VLGHRCSRIGRDEEMSANTRSGVTGPPVIRTPSARPTKTLRRSSSQKQPPTTIVSTAAKASRSSGDPVPRPTAYGGNTAVGQGVHPKIVQERLGHSQISLTLDVYSHVLPGMGREAATKLDALLKRAAEETAGTVAKLLDKEGQCQMSGEPENRRQTLLNILLGTNVDGDGPGH